MPRCNREACSAAFLCLPCSSVYYTGPPSLSTHSQWEIGKCLDGPGGPLCLAISCFELIASQGHTVHSSANSFSIESLHQTALDKNHTEMQPSSLLMRLPEEWKWDSIWRGGG